MKGYKISCVTTTKDKKALVEELVENMRLVDKKEIEGMGFSTVEGAEVSIYETSPVYLARGNDGRLIACWGLQILMGKEKNTYLIWALGTDEIEKYRKSFAKESRQIIRRWADLYGELTNTVACFNTKSIEWLKWVGAEFSAPREFNGIDYMDFIIRKRG